MNRSIRAALVAMRVAALMAGVTGAPLSLPGIASASGAQAAPEVVQRVTELSLRSTHANYLDNLRIEGLDPARWEALSFLEKRDLILAQSMSGDPKERWQVIERTEDFILDWARTRIGGLSRAPLQELFESARSTKPFDLDIQIELKKRLRRVFEENPSPIRKGAHEKARHLCGPGGRPDCTRAVQDALAILQPAILFNAATLSLPDDLEVVLTEALYTRAAATLALTTLRRARDAEAQTHLLPDLLPDLLEDTRSAFQEADPNLTPEQVDDAAIRLLGVLSTRGAGMAGLFEKSWKPGDSLVQKQQVPVIAALSMTAATISYLDSVTTQSGHPYSLPKDIVSHCDYSRAYHFWLSPLLVRRLTRLGHSPEIAMEAVHRLGIAYELKAQVSTNQPERIRLDQPDAPYNVETQKDVYFNGLGAYWEARRIRAATAKTGARPSSASLPRIDADLQFYKMLEPRDRPEHRSISEFFYIGPSFLAPVVQLIPFFRPILPWANAIRPFTVLPEWLSELKRTSSGCPSLLASQ